MEEIEENSGLNDKRILRISLWHFGSFWVDISSFLSILSTLTYFCIFRAFLKHTSIGERKENDRQQRKQKKRSSKEELDQDAIVD